MHSYCPSAHTKKPSMTCSGLIVSVARAGSTTGQSMIINTSQSDVDLVWCVWGGPWGRCHEWVGLGNLKDGAAWWIHELTEGNGLCQETTCQPLQCLQSLSLLCMYISGVAAVKEVQGVAQARIHDMTISRTVFLRRSANPC